MRHSQALRIRDEMREASYRAWVARRLNGSRWIWVVVCPNGDKTEIFESVAQWETKKQEASA